MAIWYNLWPFVARTMGVVGEPDVVLGDEELEADPT
jgi:hypothetical protein